MKNKLNTINVIKWLGFTVLFLLLVNMIISVVKNRAGFDDAGEVTEITDWVLTDAYGNSEEITVPYSGTLPKGETYTITTTLPDINMDNDAKLFINAVQSDVTVYVGDEERLSYLGVDMKVPLVNAPTRYLFVPISEDDIGKTITIKFMSMTRYNGKVYGVSVASEAAIWMEELGKHGVSFALCLFGIVIAICVFGISFVAFGTAGAKSLRYLSIGGMCICLWLLCEHRLNQLIFSQPLITGIMTYVFVLLMPIPMILYFNEIEGKRYERILSIEACTVFSEFVIMALLSAFTTVSFSSMMPVHFVLIAIVVATAVTIVCLDCRKPERHLKTYMYSAVGMVIFGATAIIEIMALLFVDFYVVGIFIVPGLIVMVFMTSMQVTVDTLKESERKREVLEQSTINTIRIIAGAIDARDEYTGGHSSRVAYYASTLIKEMGYSDEEVKDMYYVGLLHDIGKIGIPDSILNKAGKLTNDEYGLMKFHPVIGAELLSKLETDERLIQGIRSHHERYDGTGYPDGLKGEEIPKIARVLCLADSYDAMTSNRVYRNRLSAEEVEAEIMRNAGTQFDPELAKIFCNLIKTGVISPTTYNGFEKSEDGNLSKSAVIQRMIIQPDRFAGSSEVSRPEFMRMLMYILKIAERNKTDACVLLYTLKSRDNKELSPDELSEGMGMLQSAMSRTSKSSDVTTQYSENQRIVALIGVSDLDYKFHANETVKLFNELNTERKYDITYRVVDWNNEKI